MSQSQPAWPEGAPTQAPTMPVAQADVETRFGYLKDVYALLLGGIAAFVGLEVVLFSTGLAEAFYEFVVGTSWLLVLGGFMVLSWLANSTASKARSRGQALAGYGLLVLAQALIFSPMLYIAFNAQGMEGVVSSAVAVTFVGFLALSGVALTSAKDFTFLGAMLKWGGVGVLLLIVAAVVFGLELGTWFSVGMIVFAGAAILYDTQKILRHYPVGTEVIAAMQLFSSVALLFWYVLRLFMSRD